MKLLDLYCGVGGASAGYEQAGFTETWLEDDLDNGLIPYFRHAV